MNKELVFQWRDALLEGTLHNLDGCSYLAVWMDDSLRLDELRRPVMALHHI